MWVTQYHPIEDGYKNYKWSGNSETQNIPFQKMAIWDPPLRYTGVANCNMVLSHATVINERIPLLFLLNHA